MRDKNTMEALSWWKDLPLTKRKELASEYKPHWTFEMVAMSTSTIRLIYGKEAEKTRS